jgi:hypothetical protein
MYSRLRYACALQLWYGSPHVPSRVICTSTSRVLTRFLGCRNSSGGYILFSSSAQIHGQSGKIVHRLASLTSGLPSWRVPLSSVSLRRRRVSAHERGGVGLGSIIPCKDEPLVLEGKRRRSLEAMAQKRMQRIR